jgi:hypothetical protein
MTFRDFWQLYLRAHSLPGTRALHYFATAVGAMSVVQAVSARQPLLLGGIALGYAIAIGAHWAIERNQPLIRVNALWGAVADLRMLWLALTGRLSVEMARSAAARFVSSRELDDPIPDAAALGVGCGKMGIYLRWALVTVSMIGLAAALLDLDDLFEVDAGLHYALIQLGTPIAAFAGAFGLGIAAMATPHPMNLRPLNGPGRLSRSIGGAAAIAASRLATSEASLWRACMALLVFGALSMVMAECAEQGLSNSTQLYMAFSAVTILIAIAPVFPLNARRTSLGR